MSLIGRSVFYNPGRLRDDELDLVLVQKVPGEPVPGYAPSYEFEMRHALTGAKMGRLGLRIRNDEFTVMYAGHIGYSVLPEYRGHHYAARSCRLVLPLAERHNLNPLWITCNPDNWASRRTCEIVGAEYVETVDVPKDCDMYQRGEHQKCRYRLTL